jgi:hypothetical protein
VGFDDTVYALLEDRTAQTCRVRAYTRTGAAPLPWIELAPPMVPPADPWTFGPGVPAGEDFGFPDVRGMAPDSRGNLYLTDRANGLVWRAGARFGPVEPVAGRFGEQLSLGQRHGAPLDSPLPALGAIAVTGDDDLVVLCGDALVQITAPGTAAAPWIPALPVAAFSQAEYKSLGASSAPAPTPAPGPGPGGPPAFLGSLADAQYHGGVAAVAQKKYVEAMSKFKSYLFNQPTGTHVAAARDALLRVYPLAAEQLAGQGRNVDAKKAYEAFLLEAPPTHPDFAKVTAALAALPAKDTPKPDGNPSGHSDGTPPPKPGKKGTPPPPPPNKPTGSGFLEARYDNAQLQVKRGDPLRAINMLKQYLDNPLAQAKRPEAQAQIVVLAFQEGQNREASDPAKTKELYGIYLAFAGPADAGHAHVTAWMAAHP